jgi:hypothetical protein
MGIEIRQLHPLFVGEISGMELFGPLEEVDVQPCGRRPTATPCWCFMTSV